MALQPTGLTGSAGRRRRHRRWDRGPGRGEQRRVRRRPGPRGVRPYAAPRPNLERPRPATLPAVAAAEALEAPDLAPFCPAYRRAFEVLGRRWTGAIVRALLAGATRFTEFTDLVPGLSDRLLSERLKELEAEGIVERRVDDGRIEYRPTSKGRALAPVVQAVSVWAEEWV